MDIVSLCDITGVSGAIRSTGCSGSAGGRARFSHLKLEIVITRAAPAFHKMFMVMGCVFDINTVHKTVEKLTFQAFY